VVKPPGWRELRVLVPFARARLVGLPGVGRAEVVDLLRRVLQSPASRVEIAVAGVLDELALGLLEALGFPLARLGQRSIRLVWLFLGGRLGAHPPTDRRRLGGGRLLLFAGRIGSWHPWTLTRPAGPETGGGGERFNIDRPRSVGSRTVQSHFRVEVQSQDQATVITLAGELDLASSPALQEELDRVAASDSRLLIIDLRELDFMDSTGLSVLVRAHQRAEEQGRRLAMVKGPQQVQRLLSLTGVADRLTVVDSPEDLLGA
jgi:anti-sigma B factor antagonist